MIEQFCILASSQKGRACAGVINQVISHKKIFNFGELLEIVSIKQVLKLLVYGYKFYFVLQLKDHPDFGKAYGTLELFAFGTYCEYIKDNHKYLELNPFQINKLKQLTFVSLAERLDVCE